MSHPRSILRGLQCLNNPSKLLSRQQWWCQRRCLLTLAIETSCDDTSVSIVEKHNTTHNNGASSTRSSPPAASVHFLENITADSRQYQGIHPIVALTSHRKNLAKLINKALKHLPAAEHGNQNKDIGKLIPVSSESEDLNNGVSLRQKPDFISVTSGPGMAANLAVGLDTAKGLAVAWQIPLVGVHHMHAHLLTPRLVSALQSQQPPKGDSSSSSANTIITQEGGDHNPTFPFLSILVSGGHTLLVHSRSLTDHEVLASTSDIAIGDALDKTARDILPPSLIQQSQTTMYGKMLEEFAFPNGASDYADYQAPATRAQEIARLENQKFGWSFAMPFAQTKALAFSFAGTASTAHRMITERKANRRRPENNGDDDDDELLLLPQEDRVALARDVMTVCFEHLASRAVIALKNLRQQEKKNKQQQLADSDSDIKTLVVSGGVAANEYLRTLLRSFLDIRGFSHVEIVAPPQNLCTDNAAMIGWAGIEMFEAGWRSDLGCATVRKWSLDARAEDGGILGSDSWIKAQSG
ncbi:hypothetical protein AJ80_04274 [Polytolypa hystricis UAMH7299]|uniref:Gcp-like domain-containing protein n=1 Tax=Polytolypa hystricis (strain UAMH7299) TaxID=1447883 RepID=A0A2B7YEB1_POLH7|nr:hypothetical protein AJ80_04274 [Polytolypa hystricis UAMH7299]